MARLAADGYGPARAGGGDRLLIGEHLFAPEGLIVDEVVRFEGESDPADEQILFAVRDETTGELGCWLSSFGPGMTSLEERIAHRLRWTPH